MTFDKLAELMEINKISGDAFLESDSGWEGCSTYMEGAYYNKKKNVMVFTLGYGRNMAS